MNSANSKFIKVSNILSQLDFSEIEVSSSYNNQFSRILMIKLYLFRLIKGLKNYEKLKLYLNANNKEAFEIGIQKKENNELDIPAKRTYNHCIKNELTEEHKKVLDEIAARILDLSSKIGIVLDIAIVKEVIKEDKKNYEFEKREIIKLSKKLVYPVIDLHINKNAKFKTKDILDVLVHIASSHYFANDGAECFKIINERDSPSGELILKRLSELKSKSEIKSVFNRVLDLTFDYLKNNYNILKFRSFDIAYDIHQLKYWGKDIEYVCGGKPEEGVTDFFKFLTCSIVVAGHRFILDVVPIHQLYPIHKYLDESLKRVKNKIRIDKVYLDRGFNSIDNIGVLKNNKVKFIMPIQNWNTVKAHFFKDQSDRDAVVFNDFIIGDKKRHEKVNLFIIKSDSKRKRPRKNYEERPGEKHGFITNFDLPTCLACRIYRMYSQRISIETSYRQLDYNFLPRTTTLNYNIRLFYFLFSCVLFNLWIFVNIRISLIIYGRVTKKPLISVKRFCLILCLIKDKFFDNGG